MKIFKILAIVFIVGIILFLCAVGFFVYAGYQIYMPLGSGEEEKTILIEKGQSVKEIAVSLKKERLIRSSFWFETYVWLEQGQSKLQAGQYLLSPGYNIPKIFDIFSQGAVLKNEVWVTIQEGLTLKQAEEKLKLAGLASAQGIGDGKVKDFSAEYNFLSDAPQDASLEGFIFPDTYKFKKDSSQKEILNKILGNFEEKLSTKLRQDIKTQGKKIFEIVTMASLIEKEARTEADRKIVSGILWARVNDKYPLELDASLSYIFDDNKPIHSLEETKVDSPYNTYKYAGLPPGPISNPGLASIQAAIYPEPSDYYFFLTKPDTGEAVFAKTLKEHNLNKAKYLK